MKVLVYSDDTHTRAEVVAALGKRPHPDLPEVEYVECATEPVVLATMDGGGVLYESKDPLDVARLMEAVTSDTRIENAVVESQEHVMLKQ